MAANEICYKRKANHECTYCGAKLPDNYKLSKCENCLKAESEMTKYARKMAIKAGLCTICRARKARPGRVTCELEIRRGYGAAKAAQSTRTMYHVWESTTHRKLLPM